MATQKTKFASEATVKAIATESKNYAKEVSAVTITTDTTTDVKYTIYNFTQNGVKIGSVKVDKENFVDTVTVVDVAADTIIDPSNPGTEGSPNYLEAGKYLKITFKDTNQSTIYVKTTDIGGDDMVEITAEEVSDMFKEDITLTIDEHARASLTVTAKGQTLNNNDIVKEGWVLTLSAPYINPEDSGQRLNVIIVKGNSIPVTETEDGNGRTGTYTVTAEDEKRGTLQVGISYTAI